MPRIPLTVARSPLPTAPGTPRGGQQVPVVPSPLTGDPGATALERSLQVLPQTTLAIGATFGQLAELEQRRQHAQNVLDGTLSDQDFAQRMDRLVVEQQERGDYRTMPQTVMESGARLIEEVAHERNLTPQAKALFTARAQERLTGYQQHALAFRSKRMDEDTLYALTNAVVEAQQGVALAVTPAEQALAQTRLSETINAFRQSHLGDPVKLATVEAQTLRAMQKNRALVAIRARPLDAYGELQGMSEAYARGETPVSTTEAFRGLPPELLAELTDDAWQHLREEGTYREHALAATDRQRAKEQETTARALFADLTSIPLTAEGLPAIETHMRRINDQARAGTITYGQQQSLMADALQWRTAAQKPPVQRDDPGVESLIALKMLLVGTQDDVLEIRQDLVRNHTRLTPETLGRFDGQLRQRETNLVLMQDDSYKAGRQVLLDRMVPEAALLGMPGAAAMLKEEDRQRLSDALRAFEGAMAPLSAPQRQVQWRALAEDAATQFLGRPAGSGDIKSLPQFLWQEGSDPFMPQPVPREEAIRRIERSTRDDAFRGALLRRYDQAVTPPPVAPTPPTPSASSLQRRRQ